MRTNKEVQVGVRLTAEEKKMIETIKGNAKMSEFLREAIFSHIGNINDNAGAIDVSLFLTQLNVMKKSITILEQKLQSYDVSRLIDGIRNTKA